MQPELAHQLLEPRRSLRLPRNMFEDVESEIMGSRQLSAFSITQWGYDFRAHLAAVDKAVFVSRYTLRQISAMKLIEYGAVQSMSQMIATTAARNALRISISHFNIAISER